MENFPKALEYAGIAFDSAGTAEEKFNAYLGGTEASLNSLKAAFEGFARDTLSAGVIKDLVDFGTILLNLVNNPLTSFILKMTAMYAGLKLASIAIKGIATHLGTAGLAGWLGKVSTGFALLKAEGLKATVAINGTKTAAQGAAAAMSALNLAIGAAALVITGIITIYQKAKQAHEEEIQKIKEHAQQLEQETKSIQNLITEYKKLASQEIIDDTSRESIKNIQEQIVELVGNEGKELDLVNGKLEDQINIINKIRSSQAEQREGSILRDTRLASQELSSIFEDVANVDVWEQTFTEAFSSWSQVFRSLFFVGDAPSTEGIKEANTFLNTLSGVDYQNIDEAVNAYEKINEEITNTEKEISKLEADSFDNNEDKIEALTYKSTRLNDQAGKLKEGIDNYKQALQSAAQIEISKALGEQVIDSKEDFEKLKSSLTTSKSEFEKEYIISLLTKEFPQYSGEVATAREKTLGYVDSIENLKSAYDTLTTALEDYNTNGSFSLENFEKLMQLQPEYLGYLFDENGQIKDNTTALYDKIAAQQQEQAVQATLAWMDTLEAGNSAAVMAALAGETEAVNDLTAAYAEQIKVKALSLGLDADTTNAVIKRATAMANALSKISYGGGGKSSSGSAKNSAKKEEDKYAKAISYVTATIDKKIKALEKEKEAIEDVVEAQQEELDQYDKALSYINKYVSARIKELEDEKKALEDKNDETSREIELEELRNNLQKARQRTMRVYYEGQGKN